MKQKFINLLANIPLTRLPAALIGVIALLAVILAMIVYPRYLRWQQVHEERTRLESLAASYAQVTHSVEQTSQEISQLEKRLTLSASSPDELAMSIMREMNALSLQYDLKLKGISPGAASSFLMLDEAPIAVELTGQYQNIVRWIHSLNGLPTAVSVSRVSMKPAGDNGDVALSAVVSAYHYEVGR